MKCVVVDYGCGNIGSILNMLKKIGFKAEFSNDKSIITRAERVILPGVGAFDHCVEMLQKSGLVSTLEQCAFSSKKPFLGICVGMQLLLESSQEGKHAGLSWIAGCCEKFVSSQELRVPHMGWNTVKSESESPLFEGIEHSKFYFVHSYRVSVGSKNIIASTNYGEKFASAIQRDNIFGVQFHPEKSHKHGMALLKNFMEL